MGITERDRIRQSTPSQDAPNAGFLRLAAGTAYQVASNA
jgi:hypothetical protein